MRAVLGVGLGLVVAFAAGAQEKKDEKVDAKLLVGKWKQYSPADGQQLTSEFTADGKVRTWIDLRDGTKPALSTGTYKVTGNKLVVVLDDEDRKGEFDITKLTKDEFHTTAPLVAGTFKMKRVEPEKK